jgi:hypothetical protein
MERTFKIFGYKFVFINLLENSLVSSSLSFQIRSLLCQLTAFLHDGTIRYSSLKHRPRSNWRLSLLIQFNLLVKIKIQTRPLTFFIPAHYTEDGRQSDVQGFGLVQVPPLSLSPSLSLSLTLNQVLNSAHIFALYYPQCFLCAVLTKY